MGLWPVYFLLISFVCFHYSKYSACGVNENLRNVGTVLFDKRSLSNHCWTNEELVTINSRRVFQDLLPQSETLNIQTDQFIADVLNYFHICVDHVGNLAVGKTKHLMLRSLADTMGGYLHSYVVPITKVSFYAGNIKYCNTQKVHDLLDELKDFLHTNGAGWKKPMEMNMFINITPITVTVQDPLAACNQLIYNPPILQRNIYKRQHYRSKKKKSISHYYEYEDDNFSHNQESLRLFLPYLDNDVKPNSIALPFKDHNLWSLYEEESVSVLSKYYEISVNCISSTPDYERILAQFNRDFYKWLLQSVYPRLNDDKWYPAFGGVLRIIAFLKIAVESDEFATTAKADYTDIGVITTSKSDEDTNQTNSLGTTELIMIAVASAALVWLLVGLVLICYRCLCKHSDECSPCSSPKSDVAMLYKNDEFCEIDTCQSVHSRRSIGEKVKEWWQNKFKTCPGGCDRTLEKEKCLASFNYSSKESECTNGHRRSYRRRKKKYRSVSVSASPSSSPCTHYSNKKFHYSSDISSSNSDSSYR